MKKKTFLDQSIRRIFYLVLKTIALVAMAISSLGVADVLLGHPDNYFFLIYKNIYSIRIYSQLKWTSSFCILLFGTSRRNSYEIRPSLDA